jgi:predicted phage gp36 major capsid-like protein
LDDLWGFKQSVANRFKSATRFVFNSDTLDHIWQFVAIGDEVEAQAMSSRDGTLLGRPFAEWNDITSGAGSPAGNAIIGPAGDFNAG